MSTAVDAATPYDRDFFAMHLPWRADYDFLADALMRAVAFDSVLDLGCGTAFLLARFAAHGKRVAGVEASDHAREFVPAEVRDAVVPGDLTTPLDLARHDLVVCAEVAEHLPASRADHLVETICRAAGRWIFFTAAVPGQGGFGHINEQPHAYWIERFEPYGARLDPARTQALRAELLPALQVTWWFARNAMLFRRDPPVRAA
ncbi:MAG: class I SAM-dependent methyltransferase [Alphaproteobacteria bacterium]|nr:class I SAM-dependent methyltransferase [Alphaproteobacteria bacterium]